MRRTVHLPKWSLRPVAIVTMAAQLLFQVPIAAAAAPQQPAPQTAAAAPSVRVNRTVPKVRPPALYPALSSTPTLGELTNARVFGEPFIPIGGTPSAAENRALGEAIQEYLHAGRSDAVAPFLRFVTRFPQSPWVASVFANVGSVYANTGYFSKALNAWNEAWRLAKDIDTAAARAIADPSITHMMELRAKTGDAEQLEILLAAVADRRFEGSAAGRVMLAREALHILKFEHRLAEPSGPQALQQLLRLEQPDAPINSTLDAVHATPAGMSMPELLHLSKRVGLSLQMARWDRKGSIPIPSVVHLKLGHFSAAIGERDGRVLLRDPIMGGEIWLSPEALQEESSGYLLIRNEALPAGFVAATEQETAAVIGRCGAGYPNHDDGDGPFCGPPPGSPPPGPPPGSPPPGPPTPPPGPCGSGMPVYQFHTLQIGVQLLDTPVGYTPPVGPAVHFLVRYNQHDSFQPATFTYSNLGPKWTFDFLSHVTDDPGALSNQVILYPRNGGGRHKYVQYDSATQTYAAHWRTEATLVRTSVNPIRYERRLPDGAVEVFAQPDGAATYPRRVFMTAWRDRQGQELQFTYDSSLRMVAITDAIGQVTTVSYELASDPLKITKVTDPFGRSAIFRYNNAGHLDSITDVIGLTSSFRYGTDSFVAAMTTPYGTTTFRHGTTPVAARWLEATDPLGATERLEYRYSTTELPNTLPAGEVPGGFETRNVNINFFNSVYWDKLAYARHPGDITKAVVTKWIRDDLTVMVNGVKHSEKRPLEGRVWYAYPNQTNPEYMGSLIQPSRVGRVLDDGTWQVSEAEYNVRGYPTAVRDPLGRETTYIYAANAIDLLEARQTTGALDERLVLYSNYNGQHLPASVTDAAGQVSSFAYNAAGQVLTVTNAKNETTTLAYAATTGYLQSVTGPMSGATTTFTYDGYGRVRTVTDSDAYAVTYDYDALDRPTRATYPDTTADQLTYERLDVAQYRDRFGRITRYFYDPLRRLTLTRDPLGRAIQQQWCGCGTLDALVDGNGNKTSWERDVRARVMREIRADGSDTDYVYETTTSRLKSVTDAKNQVTTYSYFPDDQLQQVAYTNDTPATPDVSFTYDTPYGRMATMLDGIGTTTYGYHPVGQLGALRVATIDAPGTNDTLTYGYDQLGRVVSRALNGVAVTWQYDALGRVTAEGTPLGNFTFTYDGATARLASSTYPNNQTSAYTYFGNTGDRRLQTIHHKYPSGATLSKFDYTYNVVGDILTWRQQADATAVLWQYGYDAADQLIAAVKRSTDPQPVVLKRYGYTYDAGGNRRSEQIDDVVTGATYDARNRLLAHSATGPQRIAGTLNEPGTVAIDDQPAVVDAANAFEGAKTVSAGTNTFTILATDSSGNSASRSYQVPATGSSRTFSHDANGNLTSDGTRTFEWDAVNRLVAVNAGTHRSEFAYNGYHRRVRVVEKENGATVRDVQVFWDGTATIEERLTTGEVNRFFTDGEQHNGVPRYVTRDHLGSIREVADGAGSVVTRTDYDPYGRLTRVAGNEDSRFGFTGHVAHAPSGLALALYRAYDPALGRWLSEDPIGLAGGVNFYGYVRGQPNLYWDPLGLDVVAAIGVNGSAGANLVFGIPFVGGGLSVGVNLSTGQVFVQAEVTITMGAGAFAGVGLQGSAGISDGTPTGLSTTYSAYGEANAGWGPSVGGSVSGNPNGGGVSTGLKGKAGRIGAGYGVNVGAGVSSTTTLTTPPLWGAKKGSKSCP